MAAPAAPDQFMADDRFMAQQRQTACVLDGQLLYAQSLLRDVEEVSFR